MAGDPDRPTAKELTTLFNLSEDLAQQRLKGWEKKVWWENLLSLLGLIFGLVVTLAGFVLTYLLVTNGHTVEGTIFASAEILALAKVFTERARLDAAGQALPPVPEVSPRPRSTLR